MAKKLTKKELIEILVNDYGYDKDDIKMLTNAKLEGMIEQEQKDAVELENDKTVVSAKASKIKDDDMIVVMNGLNGSLTHRSRSTGRIWKFKAFGQRDKIPYGELLSIRNISPVVFEEGWMVILNRQIQDDFGLTDVYKNILTPENVDAVFAMSIEDMSAFVDALPQGMKVTFVAKARELYNAKKLDSRRVIEFIEGKFGISLEDNAPLSDIV